MLTSDTVMHHCSRFDV